MAISFTGASSYFTAGGGSTTASGSYTCPGGSNRIMFISVSNFSGADDITTPTYAGVSATLIAKKGFNTLASPINYTYLYYLVAPTTGSNTLSVTRTNTTSGMQIACTTYDGASQTSVPDSYNTGGTDDAATVATSTTTVADNCWVVIGAGSQRNLTASSGVTLRAGSGVQYVIGDSNGNITPAGSTSMTLAISGASSRLTGTIMASFAPAVSGPANLKSLDTNVKANIKSYNTNAIANVKSINTNA